MTLQAIRYVLQKCSQPFGCGVFISLISRMYSWQQIGLMRFNVNKGRYGHKTKDGNIHVVCFLTNESLEVANFLESCATVTSPPSSRHQYLVPLTLGIQLAQSSHSSRKDAGSLHNLLMAGQVPWRRHPLKL